MNNFALTVPFFASQSDWFAAEKAGKCAVGLTFAADDGYGVGGSIDTKAKAQS